MSHTMGEYMDWWAEMNAFGKEKAAERGLTEADVEKALREVRRERADHRHRDAAGSPGDAG